jgi:Lysozyme inhibitor LprI
MIRTMKIRSIALLLLASMPLPALSQNADVTGTDRASMSACLRESLESPSACIGSIAVICARGTSGGDRREIEVTCARRETAVWRERLDAASGTYAQRLEAGARTRFVALQRTWESYTAQKCAFFGDTQPPARAATMQAGCGLRELATRTNEIERELRLKNASTSRGGSQQPKIER